MRTKVDGKGSLFMPVFAEMAEVFYCKKIKNAPAEDRGIELIN